MGKANKKQRHRAKREAKRREARKQKSISPVRRLADATGEVEYWMSEGFDNFGQAQLLVYKRAGGLTGTACFLIDRGVVGLKDAFMRFGIERSEFKKTLDNAAARGVEMRLVSLPDFKQRIASAARWAHENGMRLPKQWVKCASLVGGVGDWMSADVSGFVKEFVGHPEDLRRRLVREPFDSYVQRPEITFFFSANAPYLDQETGEYEDDDLDDDEEDNDEEDDLDDDLDDDDLDLDELDDDELNRRVDDIFDAKLDAIMACFAPTEAGLVEETNQWLAARGETASPELNQAWRSMLVASVLAGSAMPEAPDDEVVLYAHTMLEDLATRIPEANRTEYDLAIQQAFARIEHDPAIIPKAITKYGTKLGEI